MTSCRAPRAVLGRAAPAGVALFAVVALLAGSAHAAATAAPAAKPPPPAMAPPPGGAMTAEMRAKIEHRIKTMRAMFLTETLDLDEPTSKKLFAVLDRYDEKRKVLMAERETLMRSLRKAAGKAPASDAEVDALIEKLGANRIAEVKLNVLVTSDVKPILTAEQRARLVVALPKFYNKVRKLIHEARKDMLEKALDDEDIF